MDKKAYGVFCIALASLLLELVLIRVFDVLWYPNMAYLIITLAVFSFGLAGVYLCVVKIENTHKVWFWLSATTFLMAICTLVVFPLIDKLPFDYQQLAGDHTTTNVLNFMLIYVVICVPFFLAGFTLALVFSHYASQIRQLYFWDLIGAAMGCVLLIPLIPRLGTVGTLYIVAGFCLLASAFFSRVRLWSIGAVIVAGVVAIVPFQWGELKTFAPHMDKRHFRTLSGVLEGTWWDPISKIDIIDYEGYGTLIGKDYTFKWIAYDGGTQTSYFFKFDGDYDKVRQVLPDDATLHFWSRFVTVSHYLKADTDAEVLVIGSAGGQEIKAALTYNASWVDGIELVDKVVELGKTTYADYTGNVMNDPRTNVRKGEGRSFLRSNNKKYDIIQINSNHTSSSIAVGSGAIQPVYLQTVEAYKEFFGGLKHDGILHINHHVYPRMVATAAQAWAEMGRENFRSHVLVFENTSLRNDLPTFLVKMTPWTEQEAAKAEEYMSVFFAAVHPFDPESSFLSDEFFEGDFPAELAEKIPYQIVPPTDDWPFFNSLRRSLDVLPTRQHEVFLNSSVASLLNEQRSTGIPIDVVHLIVTSVAALVFALFFTLIPLFFSKAGKTEWRGKGASLGYFACLGSGFIIFELVFIQIFMKLLGYPLYTYTTVLFTFLFGAGIGSLMSARFALFENNRWWIPFVGIALSTLLLIFSQQFLFDLFLQFSTPIRVIAAVLMIFPLTFFLGMPFPLGILTAQSKPAGTVAWAWAFNGLFTVVGGIFCAIFSVLFGFTATMIVAVAAYLIALALYRSMYAGYLEDQRLANA